MQLLRYKILKEYLEDDEAHKDKQKQVETPIHVTFKLKVYFNFTNSLYTGHIIFNNIFRKYHQ